MHDPLIAIVGDASPTRQFEPPMQDPAAARKAAEELGTELAKRGARLLVYGGPFLEADVVRGFVAGKPAKDNSILKWYSADNKPPPFPEEKDHRSLFEPREEKGSDWEVAFYRSVARADGVILVGGGNATKISGQVAIGTQMPILALKEFGGGAAKVWDTLSAGEDLPSRADINLMAQSWTDGSAVACVKSLLSQRARRHAIDGAPSPVFAVVAGLLFLAAIAIVPWVWGQKAFELWMLFLGPVLAGGAGATVRPMVDRVRGGQDVAPAVLATLILGVVAGGVAGLLFVTAQLTADPNLIDTPAKMVDYARRSVPYAVGIGFIAGLTSDAVFGKLLGLDVVRTSGIDNATTRQ